MTTLAIQLADAAYRLTITPTPDGWEIRTNGDVVQIGAVDENGNRLLFSVNGKVNVSADFSWTSRQQGVVRIDHIPFPIEVCDESAGRRRGALAIAGRGTALHAKMPGRIVAIPVSAGQCVKKGEPLLVMEAMKMQNELTAPCDGTITAIYVTIGQSVEGGVKLVEWELS